MSRRHGNELTVITWNVLFDLFDNELEDHEERWSLIGTILEQHRGDVIALQEVTPAFVTILLSQVWVKKHYTCTASPLHTDTVNSSGNMILWRNNVLVALEVFVCVDSFRQCSVLACLKGANYESESPVLLVTNVHLLANKANTTGGGSRALARKRELAAVIGQLQKVEQDVMRVGGIAQPLVVGDFNTSDENNNSVFGGNESKNVFVDVWPMLLKDQPGYTFDPTCNFRAARTQTLTNSSGGPKRLDRMYLAARRSSARKEDFLFLQPFVATMIGRDESGNVGGEAPPSDHFGLKSVFQIRPLAELANEERLRACLRYPGFNAWAANANSTPDTLLALVLDDSSMLGPELFNKTSSLPVPHITLLHGFVELSTEGFCEFAIQAIRGAIDLVQGTSKDEWALRFSESSLDVFEHRASATLIARPDMQHSTMQLLVRLYNALSMTFQQCHEQESRFDEGWSPHLSLGTVGTAFAARAEASKRIEDGRWIRGEVDVPVYGVTMFQRNSSDGKFYAVATVPFNRGSHCNSNSVSLEPFLEDACASLRCNFKGQCSGVLLEIQRACQAVAGDTMQAKLSVYGSHAMDAALPMFSDIDAVIELTVIDSGAAPSLSDKCGVSFLGGVACRIKVSTARCWY
jgi:poly(A) polymerase